MNKLLGQFTDDGLVRLERDAIVVTDVDGLIATRPTADRPRGPINPERRAGP